MYASPTGQRRYGFPAPLPGGAGLPQLFDLQALEAFAADRRPGRQQAPGAGQADTSAQSAGAPDDLVDSRGFAKLIGVKPDTFHRYLTDSWTAWNQDREGYLPRPDNWPGRAASLTDQVTERLPEVATRWATDSGEVVNEAAVAARLGRDLTTVRRYRSASHRPQDFPGPVQGRLDGQVVYEAAAVDAVAPAGPARRGRPRTPALIFCARTPARRLVNQPGIGQLMGVAPATVVRYATSETHGFPNPVEGPVQHGPWYELSDVLVFAAQWATTHPMWLRSTVAAWSSGDRKRTGGRKPGPRPTAADLRAVLADAETAGEQLTVAEVAGRLSERLGTDVSAQVVRRLKRAL
ncbi:hypothetical protein [Actinoplanes sp. L3-i22]|uniref:hypothetical protein n=1 Tax=Actinoplanes sp. L3-i22 TaxID=2836373 RepID=UPI001C859021|nr:hypothetical protein [Actinoplanes sp. L3-i22]